MQKKLTILFTFAIFVLVVGWGITPAQANPPPHDHGGGGGGSETATVHLAGSMFTTEIALPVNVSQATPKWIRFGNINFDLDSDPIVLDFNTSDCSEFSGDFEIGDQAAFENELVTAEIASGSFIVNFDRRNGTGDLLIQYMGDLGGNGTRIAFNNQFGDTHMVNEVIVGNTHTFTFEGTIFLRQLTPGGAANDPIYGCPGPQFVDVILTRP